VIRGLESRGLEGMRVRGIREPKAGEYGSTRRRGSRYGEKQDIDSVIEEPKGEEEDSRQ